MKNPKNIDSFHTGTTYNAKQVLTFKKAGGGGGLGAYDPPLEEAVGVLKIAHYMILRVYGNGLCGLVEVWGGLGYFGVVWVFSMDRTMVMLTVK